MVPVMLLIVMKIKHRRQWKKELREQAKSANVGLRPNTMRPGTT
jgi:hypothetical protein